MKKLLPIIIIILLMLPACKKDGNEPAIVNKIDLVADAPTIIIGQWKEGPFSYIYYYNGTEVYRAVSSVTTRLVYKTTGTVDISFLSGTVYGNGYTSTYLFTNSNTSIVENNNPITTYGVKFIDTNNWIETYSSITFTTIATINGISYNSYTYTAPVTRDSVNQ